MFTNKKTSDYYFDIIDGKRDVDTSMFKGEPEEDWEILTLEYAFDRIEDIGESADIEKLLSYIDNNTDQYSVRKNRALVVLGSIADSVEVEGLLISYLYAKHPDLRFSAFCSICEMAKRRVLSDKTLSIFIDYLEDKLKNKNISHEEVIELTVMLSKVTDERKDKLLGLASESFSEAVEDAKQFLE